MVAGSRKTLDRAEHGRSCYNSGCDCEVGRKANSDYLKAYRVRKRAEKLAAAGIEAPAAPPAEVPVSSEPEPTTAGPIELALADDLARNDGEAKFLKAVALTVARSLDGAVRAYRHDLVSPLAQRLVDVGKLLFPPPPAGEPGESEDAKRAKVLELIQGGANGEESAGGA